MIVTDLPWLTPFLASISPLPARIAVVGGAVRDLILHRRHHHPWTGLPDLDLVVDFAWPGDPDLPPAHRLALDLEARGHVRDLRLHSAYGTAELSFQGFSLDIASARQETYPCQAENPCVHFSELEYDLARRDFTINAMALVFSPESTAALSGEKKPRLLDPFGGISDLQAHRLRFLHAASMGDDPTRLVRAARYAARLGFELAAESLDQVDQTLAAWPWTWKAGDPPRTAPPALGTRLRMELEVLLEREPWLEALSYLQSLGGLELFDARLQKDRQWRWRLNQARRLNVPLLAAFLVGAGDPLGLAERLQVAHRIHRLLREWLLLRERLQLDVSGENWLPSKWCDFLEAPGISPASVALGLASGLSPRRPLLHWLLRWRHCVSPLSAQELIAQGVPRGPELGRRLRQLRSEIIDRF